MPLVGVEETQPLGFGSLAAVALAHDDGPERVARETHHHPSSLRWLMKSPGEKPVVDLDGIAKTKSDTLLLPSTCLANARSLRN